MNNKNKIYRVKCIDLLEGVWELQKRKFLFFWETIDRGYFDEMVDLMKKIKNTKQ